MGVGVWWMVLRGRSNLWKREREEGTMGSAFKSTPLRTLLYAAKTKISNFAWFREVQPSFGLVVKHK